MSEFSTNYDCYVSGKKNFISLNSFTCSSAMQTMQKSQCNSKYIRYQSPFIVSPRLSPTFLNLQDKRAKEKKVLPALESPIHSKRYQKIAITPNSKNSKIQELDFSNLEITGISNLFPIQETGRNKSKNSSEMRKISLSLLENKRKEAYYEKYRAKLRQVEILKELSYKAKILDLQKLKPRCKSDSGSYAEKLVETHEISLQTPVNFNNYNGI